MTAPHNHNGGPLIIERHPDDKMRFVQWDLDDWFDTIQKSKLKPNAIGIYQVLLCLIYKHMGALRDDDTFIASHCNCDVRTYQTVKKLLIAQERVYVVDGFIYNDRALAEIAKFCITAARKRQAATEREAAKRAAEAAAAEAAQKAAAEAEAARVAAAASANFAARIAQDLQQGLHNLGAGTAQNVRKSCGQNQEKSNEINGGSTTAVVGPCHSATTAVSQREIEREEVREEKKGQPAIVQGETLRAGGPDELPGLNGATAMIVTDVAKWLSPWSPDEPAAYKQIGEAIRIYGERAVRDGYAEMKADIADGKIRAPSVKSLYGYFRVAKERPPSKAAGSKPPLVNAKGWVRT